MRLVRRVRRGCFAAAAILAVTSLVAPGAFGEGGDDRPGTWASRASATAVQVMWNTVPEQVIPEIVNANFPDSDTQFDASISKARASTLYPGLLVAQGANLTCQFQCAPVPPYPLSAYAENPQTPDQKIQTGQTVPLGSGTLDAGRAEAHADDNKVTGLAINGRLDVPGTTSMSAAVLDFRRRATAIIKGPVAAAAVQPAAQDSALVHVDAATADTSHTFDKGALLVTAHATLKGVHLFGGQITIDSIVSSATSRTDGQTAKVDRAITFAGVEVAGQPARLDEKGVTIGPNGSQGGDGFDALNSSLHDALSAAGIDIRVLSGDKETSGGAGKANIEGLLVAPKAGDAASGGFVSAVVLGRAGVDASAAPSDSLDTGALTGDLGAPLGPADVLGGSTDNGGVALPPAAADLASGAPSRVASPTPSVNGAPVERRLVTPASFVDPAAGRLKTLYLALALTAFGLALGWRRVIPSTRRGS